MDAGEVALQIAGQGVVPTEFCCIARIGIEDHAILAEHGLLRGQALRFLVGLGQDTRFVLARLDIRLVERIDADDRTRNRGGDLPSEEFMTDVPDVFHLDPRDRMARLLQRIHRLALRCIGFPIQLEAVSYTHLTLPTIYS